MKFACEQCGTKYNIDAERVRTKNVKIKCRKCAHVITVTAASAIDEEALPAASTEKKAPPPADARNVTATYTLPTLGGNARGSGRIKIRP